MLFSEAKGRKVVSTSTAVTVGKVAKFVVDLSPARVVALRLKKTSGGDTLAWSNVTAFGADAVTVADVEHLVEAPEDIAALGDKRRKLIGKRILTATGEELGHVSDVDFDPASGALVQLVMAGGESTAEPVVGIGSYAVVVGER